MVYSRDFILLKLPLSGDSGRRNSSFHCWASINQRWAVPAWHSRVISCHCCNIWSKSNEKTVKIGEIKEEWNKRRHQKHHTFQSTALFVCEWSTPLCGFLPNNHTSSQFHVYLFTSCVPGILQDTVALLPGVHTWLPIPLPVAQISLHSSGSLL